MVTVMRPMLKAEPLQLNKVGLTSTLHFMGSRVGQRAVVAQPAVRAECTAATRLSHRVAP